jgi:6-methylsalicylate decarboxylase
MSNGGFGAGRPFCELWRWARRRPNVTHKVFWRFWNGTPQRVADTRSTYCSRAEHMPNSLPRQTLRGAMRSRLSLPPSDSLRANGEPHCPSKSDRRAVLSGLAALAIGASASRIAHANPAPTRAAPSLIDTHHHFVPPFYLAENRERIAGARGGQISAAWLDWTPQKSLDAMDAQGVSTAVLSLTSPGVWFGDAEAARRTARQCNEYAAELARTHPRRFGRFAVVPLPDTEGCLREIEYALDVLEADGIGLFTSYSDDSGTKWLGNPAYLPVLGELNRRRAVVFVHPTAPSCCRSLIPDVAPLVSEIPQDTTRAITNLLFTGTLSRFPDIRFIFAHAGGGVPMLLGRMHQYAPSDIAERAPNGIEYELRRLYYDIAGTANRPAIAALTQMVPTTQILFGSDNPFVPLRETAQGMTQLGLSAETLRAIGRDNALALLPRLSRR